MQIALIGKNTLYKLSLPKTVVGNYWLTDQNKKNEKKLINVEGKNGKWQLIVNDRTNVIDLKFIEINDDNNGIKVYMNNASKEKTVILEEYKMYGITFEDSKELFILCCLPSFEKNFVELDIKSKEGFLIGRDPKNHLSYRNKLVAKTHAKIYWFENNWAIENYDTNFGTFVNGKPILDRARKILFNGDMIFIMGLKIVIMGDKLFITNPEENLYYSGEMFTVGTRKIKKPTEGKEEKYVELYDENEYFSRAPRITNIIEREKVKIDEPPQAQDKEEMPLILTLGSSMSMGVIMLISMYSAIERSMSGQASTSQTVTTIITALVMLIAIILFPILTNRYNKRKKKRYEEKRQKRYKEYLSKKKDTIAKIMLKQKSILYENNLSPEECTQVILNRSGRLWERRIDDYDFLTVRLGIGDVDTDIDIQYPEEKFMMEDDNLVEILNDIANTSKVIKEAPITVSLTEKNISALIVNKNENIDNFFRSLMVQLIAFHSYEDLKLVFLLDKDEKPNLEYVKLLPHVWDKTRQIRFFSYDNDEMKDISKYLEMDLQERLEYKDKNYKSFRPYYLIITNNYKKIENLKIITEILKTKENVGFSLLCIANDLLQLPNECKTFINLDIQNNTGMIFENEISSSTQKQITLDNTVKIFFERICQKISNIPIKYTETGGYMLPTNYTFLEMYDVGRIEQLNVLERWHKNDSTLSLKAPIGVDTSGMHILLDIHEKFHGPHGLIAGTTGSGKSEFIITYVLSLAINYHPDDVTFILIDYKGGGLAGAFAKRGVKLPHLVGTITNIDTNELQRSLDSIQSELRRRQVMFNEARNVTDGGTIDIYKYQKLYHDGVVEKPIPHLLIICDEFAELKQQQPDFMEELMSVSRIGRSLGVHLILATQKPAGIVNDQIRSNSKFAVCLKVQEKEDSMDVIKRPDAATIKTAGQFYLQVGNDEYFVLGQSGWSGAPYYPSDMIEKKVDNSLQLISDIGVPIKQIDDAVQKTLVDKGDQLTNIVKYLYLLAKQQDIKTEPLWLDSIPETIFVKDIKRKYQVKTKENVIAPVLGEYDDPFNQRQGVVKLNLSSSGNTIIYGNAESGKETFLSTMIYDLITTHTAKEVQLYLLDFGTEALKIYKDSPQVGDVVFISDTEKLKRFFDMIQEKIQERKTELLEYNGDYDLYIKTSGKSMPMIVIALNNWDVFAETYEDDYEDLVGTLTRECTKCGIVFVITANAYNSLRYRITQNFKQKIALQMNDENDYYSVFDKVGKKRPSKMFGRGLISMDNDNIYEFQTAKICEPEKYTEHIRQTIKELNKKLPEKADPIAILPEVVTYADVESQLKDISRVPIGISEKKLRIYTYDFKKNFATLVVSKSLEDAVQFVSNVLQEIDKLKNVDVKIFDTERILITDKSNAKEEYEKFVSLAEKSNKKHTICVIIGIDKLLTEYGDMGNAFNQTMNQLEENENNSFILVETANKLKSHEFEPWYKEYITKEDGIWVGNGIDNQYLINISSNRRELKNNCGSSFGYVVKEGIAILVKLLEMKEKEDDDDE